MLLRKLFVLFVFSQISGLALAQAIDNLASYRTAGTDRYMRLYYDNDYFSTYDLYYTQGANFEWANPSLRKFPLSKLLFATGENNVYGISLEHNAYTPTSISHNDILYGDRPFAAALFLKTFAISNRPDKRVRVTSSLSTGLIGQSAGAHWIQQTIHEWINDTDPQGWQYQVKNDLVLNYEAGVEKNIMHVNHFLLINALANARVGTLNDKLSAGLVFMTGALHPAITSVFTSQTQTKKKFHFHMYAQPLVNAVLYDATLQGGVFNRKNPYTLSYDQVSRFTVQGNAGVVFYIQSVYLEYFQSVISKEFTSGLKHHFGGVRIGVNL
jgi:lipid A 3-O-deacylase